MTNKVRKSRILAKVHETASGLHQAGVISKRRVQEYDALSLLGAPALDANKIKLIREDF